MKTADIVKQTDMIASSRDMFPGEFVGGDGTPSGDARPGPFKSAVMSTVDGCMTVVPYEFRMLESEGTETSVNVLHSRLDKSP